MFENYLKIAFRNLLRHRLFSLINITGLTVGITCCLLIIQYIRFELSFDDFNTNKDRIYRIVNTENPNKDNEINGMQIRNLHFVR